VDKEESANKEMKDVLILGTPALKNLYMTVKRQDKKVELRVAV